MVFEYYVVFKQANSGWCRDQQNVKYSHTEHSQMAPLWYDYLPQQNKTLGSTNVARPQCR